MEKFKQFVDLGTAISMKKLGFKEPCLAFYGFNEKKNHLSIRNNKWHEHKGMNIRYCHCATWGQAERWLLKQKYWVQVEYHSYEDLPFGYLFYINRVCVLVIDKYKNQIDARQAGIKDLITRLSNIKSFERWK